MTIIVKRQLKDYQAWKKMVSEHNEMRKEYGSQGVTAYQNAKNPNEVFVVFAWDDSKPYLEYFSRPDVQAALKDSETAPTEVIEIGDSFHLGA